jgi:hypothetical protein
MSIERKLSKVQTQAFIGFAKQRAELQEAFRGLAEAEREQVEMLRAHFGLPDGEYTVQQEPNGDVLLRRVEQPAEAAEDDEDSEAED